MIAPALPWPWSAIYAGTRKLALSQGELAAHVTAGVEPRVYTPARRRVEPPPVFGPIRLPKRAVGDVRVRRPIVADAAPLVLLQRVDRAFHEDREALHAAGSAVEPREHQAAGITVGRGVVVVRRGRSAED